jgi:aspartyl protease family protein
MTQPEGPWRDAPPPPKKGARGGFLMWLAFLAAMGLGFLVLTRLFPGRGPGSDWPESLRLFGVLAVVSSGLVFMRRIDVGQTARHLAGWAAIFAVAIAGYAYRGDVRAGLLKVRLALVPAYGVVDSPRSMIVGRGEGDAFYVFGKVDGAPVRFLIDTGASEIVLSPADAQAAGLSPETMDFSTPSETANGVGYSARAMVRSLKIGPIRMTDVPVSINQNPMSVSLLGMPFLKRLDSFEVRGDRLYLRGRG